MRLSGFVLAGGSSRRMGRDKALLPYRGATLVEWIAGLVREAAGSVCLAGGGQRYGHLGLPWIEEPCPGLGPLSGIHAALASGRGEWSVIAAGQAHPLAAAYHRRLLDIVGERLAGRRLSVCDLLELIDVAWLTPEDGHLTASVNTPEEWSEWSR